MHWLSDTSYSLIFLTLLTKPSLLSMFIQPMLHIPALPSYIMNLKGIANCLNRRGLSYTIPWTGWDNRKKKLFSQLQRLEVLDQGAAWLGSGESFFLSCRWLPSHCVLMWGRERERHRFVPLLIRPQSYQIRVPLLWSHLTLILS